MEIRINSVCCTIIVLNYDNVLPLITISGSNGISRIEKTPIKSNGNAFRQSDVINHKNESSIGSMTSEDDRKPDRVSELNIPSNLKPDKGKESPTSSISSTMSSQSQISSSSGTSRQEAEAEDHRDNRVNIRPSRRKNIVAPAFLRRLSSTQVLEGM